MSALCGKPALLKEDVKSEPDHEEPIEAPIYYSGVAALRIVVFLWV